MRLFRKLGLDGVAWSLRRLYCPVGKNDLVLEVGSGGSPYFRSNVLIDAYAETRERHWEPLIADRPTVLGFVERLPFKDGAFDFVIASHVLEHSRDPEAFLGELQRVAKAGYIEVPDAFMERINPYLDHRLEITLREGKLVIRKKSAQQVDAELVELYEHKANAVITGETMRRHPFHFHVRYYWEGAIDFQVLNPDVDVNWPAPVSEKIEISYGLVSGLKKRTLELIRMFLSQNRRNRKIELVDLMQCPRCGSEALTWGGDDVTCSRCGACFPVVSGVPDMTVREGDKV